MENFRSAKLIMFLFIFLSFLTSGSIAYSETSSDLLSFAFDNREFLSLERPALCPNKKILAYSVRQRPDKINLSERRLSDGTPSLSSGSRIYLLDIGTKQSYDLDPSIPGDCWRPSWSPDGTKLAFYSNASGFVQLWIHDLSQNKSNKVGKYFVKSTVYARDTPYWDPSGSIIYLPLDPLDKPEEKKSKIKEPYKVKTYSGLEKKKKGDQNSESFLTNEYGAHLAAIDVEKEEVNILVPIDATPPPGFSKISPSGKWLSYLSRPTFGNNGGHASFDLAIVPTSGGVNPIIIDTNLTNKSLFSSCYRWHPNLDALIYLKKNKLYLVEFNKTDYPSIREIYENPDAELLEEPLLFDQDGTCVIVGVNPKWDSYQIKPQSLLIISLDQKNPIKEINLQGKWNYINTLNSTDSQVWQPEKSTVTTLLEDCETGETVIVKFNQNRINEYDILWKGQARISSFLSKSDRNDIFFQYEDFNTPTNLFKANSDFSQLDCLTTLDLRAEALKHSNWESFETFVPLHNGELKKVRTAILLPPGKKIGDRLPGIVIFYPGAEVSRRARRFSGGDLISIPNFLFLDRGYALILPDIILGPEGVAGNPVQEIVDTLLPQIYQAANLGYIDITKVGIVGQSYGGYGTTAAICKTNLFRSAVAISGNYDLPGSYGYFGDDLTFWNIHWSEHGQGRMGNHPWSNILGYIDNSPYYFADKIHTPLLLIHGEKDSTCNVEEARKLFSALRRLERDVQLAIYPGQGHVIHDWVKPKAIDAAERILDFFDDHLKKETE